MATSPNSAQSPVPSYVVDSSRSRLLVKATASGMLSAFGHNPTIAIGSFTGEAWFRPQAPEQSSLRFEIDATSLAISGDVNEKDRQEMDRTMKQEVLEVDRYREIRFEGSGVEANKIAEGMYRITLAGKLTLHGVEKDVQFACNVTVGGDSMRANGEFTIRQTDYRIKLVSVAGGVIKLKDELKFSFDVVANRRREAANG
jgi:polyisoprenoid-binding protein YceI